MTGPEDYRCYHCKNLVLYRIDHKPDCIFHPDNDPRLKQIQQN